MCTVTLVARRTGCLLAMNRDERRTRVRGLPPLQHEVEGVKVMCPSEPEGGTWLAVNDRRLSLALINWYPIGRRVEGRASSRGEIVMQSIGATSLAGVDQRLGALPLAATNPFRLIGVSSEDGLVCEWRWDLETLVRVPHPWRTQQWISSGYDEPGARTARSRVFNRYLDDAQAGTASWLRRLHRSHLPRQGAYSTCMHREDAATVSYTEIEAGPGGVRMRHVNGPPCSTPQTIELNLA